MEYKFRAWDKKHNFMYADTTLKEMLNDPPCLDDLELMQFIGCKDKTGADAYTEDILRTPVGYAIIKFGEYDTNNGTGNILGYYVKFINKSDNNRYRKDVIYWLSISLIVGNTFDNLELLEAGDE